MALGCVMTRNRSSRIAPKREILERILIVTEGSKTELYYLMDIRKELRINNRFIHIVFLNKTDPRGIVNAAEKYFLNGNAKDIGKKAFDRVIAVFDRDAHQSFFDAVIKADCLNNKYTNDEKKKVCFTAITSVPCFEIWLLSHYILPGGILDRSAVQSQVAHYIPGYAKGATGIYGITKEYLGVAERNMLILKMNHAVFGTDSCSDIGTLVSFLKNIKKPASTIIGPLLCKRSNNGNWNLCR